MSWVAQAPGLVALALLWLLPGLLCARALGVRGLVAWGVAAPVTSGLAGVLAVAYDLVGVPWTLVSFLIGALACAGVSAGIGALLGTTTDPDGLRVAGHIRPWARSERGWLTLTWLVGGGVLAAAMMVGVGQPDRPLQAWDGVFHLNAVWSIQDTGNASSLGGLAPLYNDVIAPYYPTVWHSLVALAPGFSGVTHATNGASIVMGSVIWIAGLVALARVVWPARVLPVVLTPLIAATYVSYPVVAVSMLGVWPFALSVACLPGTLAVMIAALRGSQRWQLHLAHVVAFLGGLAGVVLAHGSGLFSAILIATPLLLVLLYRQGRRLWRRGRRNLVVVATALGGLAGVGLVAFLVTFPPVAAILAYERGGQETYWGPIASLLADHPMIYVYPVRTVNVVVTILVIAGAGLAIRHAHARWLVVAALSTAALTLLAAGPVENPLRGLTGFWYTQASRIAQLFVIPAVILAAGGAAWAARWISRRWRLSLTQATVAVVAVVAVSTGGFRWATQVEVMASVHNNWPIAWGTMLQEEELGMVQRAAQTLPQDAVVLGEPVNGSSLLLAISDVDVVFPQLSPIPDSPQLDVLEERFDQWRTDPQVCEAVRDLGVTHVYVDRLTFEEGAKWEETTPGLRRAQAEGPAFQYVDSGGQASIWRFTGCDK